MLRTIGTVVLPDWLMDVAPSSAARQVTNSFVTALLLPPKRRTPPGPARHVTKLFAQGLPDAAARLVMDALSCKEELARAVPS